MKCKRIFSTSHYVIGADGEVNISIGRDAVEVLIRVVDADGIPQAFTVAPAGGLPWHLVAGEAWRDDRLELLGTLALTLAATAGDVVEVARWEG